MRLKKEPKHRFLLSVAVVTCFVAQCCITSADQFSWSDDSDHNMSGVKDVIADMENLSAMSTSILEFSENSTDYVSLRIETPSLENVESCTSQSNRLLLQIDSVNKSAPLICGNEVVEIHTTRFPFKLLFIKGSIGSKLQLNKFSIFVDRTTEYPHDKYSNLTISPYPRITYSPLYPGTLPRGLSFKTTFNMAETVLFQLRKRRSHRSDCAALNMVTDNSVSDTICGQELVTLVKNKFRDEKYHLYLNSGRDLEDETYEFEYRSITREREWAGRKRVLYAAEDTEFLASLGYPQDYRKSSNGLVPYRTDWMWEISSLTGQQVEIEIVDLTLDGDTSCDYTAVRVFDGPGDQFPLLGKICGQIKKNLTFRSTNEVLFIHFVYTDLSQDLPTKFKIGYYTRSSPSPGVEIGKNRLYNGLNDDDDDSLGKTTITLIIVACVLAILLAVVVVVIWKVRQRITTRDAPIEADNKTRVPLRVTYTNNKSSVNGV